MIAVFPSPDSATELPCRAPPEAPVPTDLPPCWPHTPAERTYTHAAPIPTLSLGAPTMAVFPSADSATELPCPAVSVPTAGTAPVPTSLAPCCVQTPPERV